MSNKFSSRTWMQLLSTVKAVLVISVLTVFLGIPQTLLAESASAILKGAPEQAISAWEAGLLEITFIDVGKGDAILLHLPDGRFAMIDTGYEQTAKKVVQTIRALGATRLDLVVLTHHDKDHVGGYPHIVEEFPIGKVVQSYDFRDKKKTVLVQPGTDLVDEGGVVLSVLGPWKSYEDENDASLVTRLAFGKIAFLFPGDVVNKAQSDLLNRNLDLHADVLEVPHHGRYLGFSPRPFFMAVKSRFAVITSDEPNGEMPEGSVLRMLQESGNTVLRTDRLGTIRFLTDGKKLSYQTEFGGSM